jgi:hypothetical protein
MLPCKICTVALYCKGYRPGRGQGEHYRTIQSLPLTIGAKKYEEIRDYLNSCRAKRNISDYDKAGAISKNEMDELIDTANRLYEDLKIWLQKKFPQYT